MLYIYESPSMEACFTYSTTWGWRDINLKALIRGRPGVRSQTVEFSYIFIFVIVCTPSSSMPLGNKTFAFLEICLSSFPLFCLFVLILIFTHTPMCVSTVYLWLREWQCLAVKLLYCACHQPWSYMVSTALKTTGKLYVELDYNDLIVRHYLPAQASWIL